MSSERIKISFKILTLFKNSYGESHSFNIFTAVLKFPSHCGKRKTVHLAFPKFKHLYP